MAKLAKTTAPQMSAKETKQSYTEHDQIHAHCLLLITTCTQLGNDLRDTELLKHVDDLGALVDQTTRVAERLPGLQDELRAIRERDLAMRTKRIDVNNIMQLLSIGQEYEAWTNRFQKGVAIYFNPAVEALEAAKQKRGV